MAEQRANAVHGVDPASMVFYVPVSWFVYVAAGKHQWRFVYFCEVALDGDEAISQAISEAVEMGDSPSDTTYMAVPTPAIWTFTTKLASGAVSEQAEAKSDS